MEPDIKTVCISHREDPDGLICAALLRHLKNASIFLASYEELETLLKSIRPVVQELFICDLHIREDLHKEIVRINEFADVTIVDHHPTTVDAIERFSRSGVTFVYNPHDCASVLLYNHFKKNLGRDAARLAAYAAISDQFETGTIASNLLSGFEKQLTQHEALILTHALHHKTDKQFRSLIVKELSEFVYPHRIKGVTEAALAHLEELVRLMDILPRKATRRGKLAHVKTSNRISLGAVASLLLDVMDVDVGVCFTSGGKEVVNLSIRGKGELALHLGEITRRLASKYGGFGGGHKNASGARIPEDQILKFIAELESELTNSDQNFPR